MRKSILTNLSFVIGVFGAVLVGLYIALASTGILKSFIVPTNAMSPTMNKGDWILAEGSCRLTQRFERGGLYAFSTQGIKGITTPDGKPVVYIKRLVGLPGDELQIIGDKLWINRKPQAEFFQSGIQEYPPTGLKAVTDLYEPYRVPDNHAFMIGDNSRNSSDSRIWGSVPIKNITHRYLAHLSRAPEAPVGQPSMHPVKP